MSESDDREQRDVGEQRDVDSEGVEEHRGAVRDAISSVTEASRKRKIELFTAALMALATIGTAWVSYESSRWGSVQTANFNSGNAARVESTKASSAAGQLAQVDIALFTEAVNAFASGNTELFQFYVDRARDEFEPALTAWIALEPGTNPDAPLTPFELPGYASALAAESLELQLTAEEASVVAAQANQRSDNYILAAVVFAAILFFAGVSSRFRSERIRTVMLGVATAGFVINSTWVANFPVVIQI